MRYLKESYRSLKKSIIGEENKKVSIEEPKRTEVSLAVSAATYIFNTVDYFSTFYGATPKVLKTLSINESVQPITLSVLKNIVLILPELVFFNYLGLEESWVKTPLYVIFFALTFRAFLEKITVTKFSGYAFGQVDNIYKEPESICNKDCDAKLVLLNGIVQETIAYYINLSFSYLSSFIPVVGPSLSYLLDTLILSRYLAGVTTTRCRLHESLQSEATVAIGISYRIWEAAIYSALKHINLLPSGLNLEFINNLIFTIHIAYLAHSPPPLVLTKNRTTVLDPIENLEAGIEWVATTFWKGFTELRIPELLNGPKSTIDWNYWRRSTKEFWEHPYTEKMKPFILPSIVQSPATFVKHPVVEPNWLPLRKNLAIIFNAVRKNAKTKKGKIATSNPKSGAWFFYAVFGLNPKYGQVLLHYIGQERYFTLIEDLYLWFELNGEEQDMGLPSIPPIPKRPEYEEKPENKENKIPLPATIPDSKKLETDRKPSELIGQSIFKKEGVDKEIVDMMFNKKPDKEYGYGFTGSWG